MCKGRLASQANLAFDPAGENLIRHVPEVSKWDGNFAAHQPSGPT